MIPALFDNTPRNVAAGTALLLPAAGEPDRAVVVSIAFVLVALAARAAAGVARRHAADMTFVLVLIVAALTTGLLWQGLLVASYSRFSSLGLVFGLLIVNPAILHGALAHRDGTDATAPPPLLALLIAPGVLLGTSLVIALAGDVVAVLAQPAGLLLCAGLLLAASNALRRSD